MKNLNATKTAELQKALDAQLKAILQKDLQQIRNQQFIKAILNQAA